MGSGAPARSTMIETEPVAPNSPVAHSSPEPPSCRIPHGVCFVALFLLARKPKVSLRVQTESLSRLYSLGSVY